MILRHAVFSWNLQSSAIDNPFRESFGLFDSPPAPEDRSAMSELDDKVADVRPSWIRTVGRADDQVLEENWLFRLRKERFQSRRSGKLHDYYVLHLADAVHVVALTPDDHVLLVRQFRAGSGEDSLEIPGGLVDPGEDPCEAGARELLEETGHAGDPPEFLGTLWSNPSLLTSRISTIVIRNVRPVAQPRFDQHEELTLEQAPARDIPRLIREGRISHALVVAGLLWWLGTKTPGMFEA